MYCSFASIGHGDIMWSIVSSHYYYYYYYYRRHKEPLDADGVMLNKLKCFCVVTSTNRYTTASNMPESLAVDQPMPEAR